MDETSADRSATLTVDIAGMHCPNCETLIEQRVRSLRGVHAVTARTRTGTATIRHDGSIDIATLQDLLGDEDYQVLPEGSSLRTPNTRRDFAEALGILLLLVAAFILLKRLDAIPNSIGVSDNMSYGLAFLIGLVASVSTCMAVTGGLLIAAAAKYNDSTGALPGTQRLKPLLYFNAGRIASYTLFGALIGALGSAFALSAQTNGILTLVVSFIMVVLGLQMLHVIPPLGALFPGMSKRFSHQLHDFARREAKGGAFLLGSATFFLPCGFTQSLQLYVLAQGDPWVGAMTMLVFALGTLPALLSLSALSSFVSGGFQRHFLKVAGAAVLLLGVLNIQYGLTLTSDAMKPVEALAATYTAQEIPAQTIQAGQMSVPPGDQILRMRVSGFEYAPNHFTVTAGKPVEWRIDGSMAAGCGRLLISPGLGIRTILETGAETVVRFTPHAPGIYAFNCGMGMMTKGSVIIVRQRS